MKRVIGNLYTLKGMEAGERTQELRVLLGLGTNATGYVMADAVTTGVAVTGATTSGVYVTGNATNAFRTGTGTFTYGILLGGTLGTGISIGACTTAAIDITAVSGRAIRIGTKGTTYANSTALAISSLGGTLDTDPAKNYMVGVFTKVSGNEDTGAVDDLGGAWFRTRIDKGATTPAGYSVFGVKSQLRIYSENPSNATVKNWAAAGELAVLEVSGATTTFASGCVAAALYANVSLTTTSVISSGAVVAGIVINSASAAITNTGSAYYGLQIQDYAGTSVDFDAGVNIANSCCTTGVKIGTCTTGLSFAGTHTTAINIVTAANVTNFITFNAIAGCILNTDVNPKDVPSGGGLGADACIRIVIGTADYFIPIFAVELS
jgi:hypothetical protein